ncbi:MAG: M15 family metallopeptidase [Micrococcales bacterium]|nr:M15 family metallopeptidase [Micrococcales bacterium]
MRASPGPTSRPTPTPTSTPTPTPAPPPVLPALSIDDPASDWVVVDKLRPLNPIDYAPPLAAIALVGQGGALRMRPAAAVAVAALAAQFRAETGLALGSVSDYRPYASQVRVYNQTRNDSLTARPGYSEHQTGLAIDFSSPAEGGTLQAAFGATRTGQWLAANAWRWGFILRYPDGLQPITGFQYEPWHFRYVGVPLATAMRERGIRTLEEWFRLPAAPTYP